MITARRPGRALLGLGVLATAFAMVCGATLAPAAEPSKRTAAPACNRAQFRTVVDVGHTLESPGAESARGVWEYDFNLRLAKQVSQRLHDMGFGRTVLLVTKGKTRHGLAERVARANASGADLFLSIHHDSVPDRMLQEWEFEGTRHRFNDQYPGHSIFVSVDNPRYQASLLFAVIMGKEMKARGLAYTPHYTDAIMGSRRRILVDSDAGVYRYDQLIVLRQTHMPAALLEAGSIVNRRDELVLASPERLKTVAAAIGEAVDKYCGLHPPQATETVAKHEPGAPSKPAARPVAATLRAAGTQASR
jgi:N-acetylmuramoyl-L-alanine amidase